MAYASTSYGGGSGGQPVVAGPPPVTVDVAGLAARAQRGAAGGAQRVPANDNYVARLTMAGTSGSGSYIVENAAVETGEPAQGVAGSGTVWWSWAPGYLGVGTVDAGTGMVIDAYLDPLTGSVVDLTALAGAPGSTHSVSFDVRPGETYAIRAYAVSSTDTGAHTLTWSTALAPLDFTLASTTIPWAPGAVTAYIANDTASSTINLSFDGGATVQTVTADTEGYVTFPLDIPALTVGSHTVTATSSSGRTGTVTFTVVASGTFVPPTPPTPPDVLPPVVVNRWQLQDPVTSEVWEFPINPITEGAAILPRVLTSHWTVAHDGQPIVFEGGRTAKTWQLTGTLLTLAHLNALRGWQRAYRVYLTDDLQRTFVVKVHKVASQPPLQSIDPEHPEAYKYTVDLLLFERVTGVHPIGVGP